VAILGVMVVALGTICGVGIGRTYGSLSATTSNSANTFTAAAYFGCSSPSTQTLTANADDVVSQSNPTSNYGTLTSIYAISSSSGNARSLVNFSLPSVPQNCYVTAATLKLYVTSGTIGRTIQVYQAAGSWTETGATWNNQPTTTGSAATAASTSTVGYAQWNVASEVQAMETSTAYGFLVKDFAENNGTSVTQTYSSREGANAPQLVITFGDMPSPPPPIPTNLTATTSSSSQIALSWTDNASNEDGFKIERSASGANSWTQIGTVGANVTTYSDTGLSANTAYDYRVRAYNSVGNSGYSNIASATTPAPTAPSGLSATATSSAQINLSWTDNSSNEDGFKIERSPGGANTWSQIVTVGANVTTYADTGLSSGTTYDYRVRAYSNTSNSSYSNTASATTLVCSAPGSQTVTSNADAYLNAAAATTNYGSSSTTFGVRSYWLGNARSVVQFPQPTAPYGCSVASATLRIYDTTPTVGRTLDAYQASSSWTESTVTWNTQPSTTGSASQAVAVSGWVEWNVSAAVANQYSGSNYGFLVRDSSEGSFSVVAQAMSTREGANPPQLVITWGDPGPPGPGDPSGLCATASTSA